MVMILFVSIVFLIIIVVVVLAVIVTVIVITIAVVNVIVSISKIIYLVIYLLFLSLLLLPLVFRLLLLWPQKIVKILIRNSSQESRVCFCSNHGLYQYNEIGKVTGMCINDEILLFY